MISGDKFAEFFGGLGELVLGEIFGGLGRYVLGVVFETDWIFENEVGDAVGVIEGEADGEHAAHGVTDDGGLVDAEVIEEAGRLAGEECEGVGDDRF
jgi:hypothetical protein